jgi:antitoxin component of MazEF toxin-antitoxin module
MIIKTKLRRIGNSLGVILPREVITSYNLGDEIDINVITKQENVITNKTDVITKLRKDIEKIAPVITDLKIIPDKQ